jgi:molecular chaperone HscB
VSQSVCASCGVPQPVGVLADYYSIFGLPRRFAINLGDLERRFYQLSRALHPDRFTTAMLDAKTNSLARMSLLNQAYSALKNPDLARAYLIQLAKTNPKSGTDEVSTSGEKTKTSIPMELAESWFELQEAISEDSSRARVRLTLFESEFKNHRSELEKKMSTLESNYDLNPSQPLLDQLERELQTKSYLKSMERDLERLKKNAYSD